MITIAIHDVHVYAGDDHEVQYKINVYKINN